MPGIRRPDAVDVSTATESLVGAGGAGIEARKAGCLEPAFRSSGLVYDASGGEAAGQGSAAWWQRRSFLVTRFSVSDHLGCGYADIVW